MAPVHHALRLGAALLAAHALLASAGYSPPSIIPFTNTGMSPESMDYAPQLGFIVGQVARRGRCAAAAVEVARARGRLERAIVCTCCGQHLMLHVWRAARSLWARSPAWPTTAACRRGAGAGRPWRAGPSACRSMRRAAECSWPAACTRRRTVRRGSAQRRTLDQCTCAHARRSLLLFRHAVL
jgi:hypothetical protein